VAKIFQDFFCDRLCFETCVIARDGNDH
jgi:hypothetical protein